jgi:ferric-dicitrate binding protein FerR (iron transport regulator)
MMPEHGLDRRAYVLSAIAAGLTANLAPMYPAFAQSPAAGSVRALSGQAQAELKAAVRQLVAGEGIFVGDRISTGSGARASIALGTATELKLGSQARIRIDRFLVNAGGVIVLDSGAMAFDRDPAREEGEISIRSAFGLIAVRGTRFFAGPSNGVFGVFVERGSVAVTGGGKQVMVSAGEGTDIARPGAAPTVPKAWGSARVQSALAQVR